MNGDQQEPNTSKPSGPPAYEPATSPPLPKSGVPGWAIALMVIGGVLIAGVVAVIVLLVTGEGNGSEETAKDDVTAPETEDATFDVRGEITLIDSDNENYSGSCYGGGGYDDMAGGAQVVIRDSMSKTIGAGQLADGVKIDSVTCEFSFAIEDVPSGNAPYSIEVSHRGEVVFNEDEALTLSLSLG